MKKFHRFRLYLYLIAGSCIMLSVIYAAAFMPLDTFLIGFFGIGVVILVYALLELKLHLNIIKRLPKVVQYICNGFTIVMILLFIVIESFIIVGGFEENSDVKPDYIIVLGAGLTGDAPSTPLQYRLDKALEIYEQYPDAIFITSGGLSPNANLSEAQAMKNYLMSHGVSEDTILMEEHSKNTYENIKYSYALTTIANPKVMIVTNNFHSFRAKLTAQRLGIDVYVNPSQKLVLAFPLNYIREFFSVMKTVIFE